MAATTVQAMGVSAAFSKVMIPSSIEASPFNRFLSSNKPSSCIISITTARRVDAHCMSEKDLKPNPDHVVIGLNAKFDDSSSNEVPPEKAHVTTRFEDVFAFSGSAPERINGRLAMLGFVAAAEREIVSGQDLACQIRDGGIASFIGAVVLISAASFIPMFKGVSADMKSNGLFSAQAEMWNGRAAMIGLVALAFSEYVTGHALFTNMFQ